jgi:hypothetical protein
MSAISYHPRAVQLLFNPDMLVAAAVGADFLLAGSADTSTGDRLVVRAAVVVHIAGLRRCCRQSEVGDRRDDRGE